MQESLNPFRFPVLDSTKQRASGIVNGCIVGHDQVTGEATLLCPDGSTFSCRVINLGGKKLADRGWQPFLTYPNSNDDELKLLVAYPFKNAAAPDRYFEVQGVVTFVDSDYVTVSVWSEHAQKLSYVLICGFLKRAKKGQVWWFECDLDQSGLHLVDAEKVADDWTMPEPAVRKPTVAISLFESRPVKSTRQKPIKRLQRQF